MILNRLLPPNLTEEIDFFMVSFQMHAITDKFLKACDHMHDSMSALYNPIYVLHGRLFRNYC